MKTSYMLAVDAGTGSGRAVIFDENGNQIASAQHEWWHRADPRFPGSMNFDVEGNWTLLSRAIRQAIAEARIAPAEIRAVSATSMREAIVAYDRNGREIWACANVDSRAVSEVRDLQRDFADLERTLYTESGQTFALGALPRLLWLKRNLPDVYARIHRISMLSDWVLARLSGVIASDPSNAGTTGLYSLSKRNWMPEALSNAGMRDDIFPESVEPGTVIGRVTEKAASETGIAAGTPVVMGGGDCQSGAAAIGVVNEGDCAVLGGTFWQQVVNVGPSVSDPSMDLRINPHVVKGLNQAEAISFFVGIVMRWFRDSFGARSRRPDPRRCLQAPGAEGSLRASRRLRHHSGLLRRHALRQLVSRRAFASEPFYRPGKIGQGRDLSRPSGECGDRRRPQPFGYLQAFRQDAG